MNKNNLHTLKALIKDYEQSVDAEKIAETERQRQLSAQRDELDQIIMTIVEPALRDVADEIPKELFTAEVTSTIINGAHGANLLITKIGAPNHDELEISFGIDRNDPVVVVTTREVPVSVRSLPLERKFISDQLTRDTVETITIEAIKKFLSR